jgi:hypothetical protein
MVLYLVLAVDQGLCYIGTRKPSQVPPFQFKDEELRLQKIMQLATAMKEP